MATIFVLLSLLAPLDGTAAEPAATAASPLEASVFDAPMRYRGIDELFAKFEQES